MGETCITTAMTPGYGRASEGKRVAASAPASWQSVTVIAAIGLGGVRAPMAFAGGNIAAMFEAHVEPILSPALRPGDVVVFDNLAPHLAHGVAEAIERAGAVVLRLPPCSPDFNPIEAMFSKFKGGLRRLEARTRDQLDEALGKALRRVTTQNIRGWFRNAGLRVPTQREPL